MRVLLAVLRLAGAALIIAALITTYRFVAASAAVNPANFFGYFTIQSNVIDAVVLAVGGIRLARGTTATPASTAVRWAVTDSMVLVGIVYAALLAPLGAAGGVPVPWANTVLHIVTPVFALVDWLIAPDRVRIPVRLLWLPLVFPAVWITVVLIRGGTDGWVPYPFLDPVHGYGFVGGMVALIAAAVAAFGLALRRLGRPAAARRPSRTDS